MPSSTLSDIGRGQLGHSDQATILERLEHGEWREIGRYRSEADAGAALDDHVGSGADPNTLRIVAVPASKRSRALLIGAIVIGVIVAGLIVYVLTGGF